MNDFDRQFVIRQDARGRWSWALFEDGMICVAKSHATCASREACLAETRRLSGIAASAGVWDVEEQAWLAHSAATEARTSAKPELRVVGESRPSLHRTG